ncbi:MULTISPECIES: hypothetical protein [unclassified Streptomyces]|uniref:hypothetical protein n=1 Tax=unclassified Streptomyces TaxID=2593676 RepID=UPI0022501678|nr:MULTISPECIES: hypothetical protein [unclassified Streptomyces]MCX5404072.1 hypothetical protein [Streptomyces sp. NBC_00086]
MGYYDSGLGSDQTNGTLTSGRPVSYLWNVDVSGGDEDLLRAVLTERVGSEYSPAEIDNLLGRSDSSFTLAFWDETSATTFAELARATGATAKAYETTKINMIS